MSNKINSREKAVIMALQDDFPLCAEPYKVLAEKIGMTEEEFINCVKQLTNEKKIRKMGAVKQALLQMHFVPGLYRLIN